MKTSKSKVEEKKLKIKDLYASDDFIAGLEAGRKISPKVFNKIIRERNKPITLGEHTWFYISENYLYIIHEIYDGEKYIRTDEIKLPKRLLF